MNTLEQHGYTKDRDTEVWVRSDFGGIAYSDGDSSETELAKIIREASDVSVLSDELPQYCTDWAKLYHLSAVRGNILRPFEHLLKGRVLEIGAGCGAISRYLGECGAELLCLEGSPRRAAIAASRTRDLDNVTVLAERFDDFKVDVQFDAVTLIGVLEYASMFSNAENPALAMLKRIRQLLKPDGHLFIAIENQLGLKYFAGAPEDHVGIAMYGIEGRYQHGQPKTFGKVELERLLASAGFEASDFMAPSPDYKLPNSIITEAGFQCDAFDAAALAWQNVKKDPQLPESTTFNLEKAWQVVFNNRLGMDLANSFLIKAACKKNDSQKDDILAYHYSIGRKTRYCKESLFVMTDDGIQVEYKQLASSATPSENEDSSAFKYVLPRIDAYAAGKVLSLDFLDSAAHHDWSIDSFAPFIKTYLDCLATLLKQDGADVDLRSVGSVLPGHYIDAVPQNIVLRPDGTPQLIDVEWEMIGGVELGHLMMRALLLLMAAANPFYPSAASFSRQEFTIGLLASAGLDISREDCERYIALEAAFQEKVTGKKADRFLDWAPEALIHKLGSTQSTSKFATLYISDAHGNFSEQSALRHEVSDGPQRLQFALPSPLAASTVFRFDPVDQRQGFSIESIKVYSGARCAWEWPGELSLPLAAMFAWKIPRADDSLYLALTDDPSLTLPVDMETLQIGEQLELEISLTIFTDAQLAREVNMLNQSGHVSPVTDLQSKLDLIVDSNKEIAHALAHVKASVSQSTVLAELSESLLAKDRKIHELSTQLQKKVQQQEALAQVLHEQQMMGLNAGEAKDPELLGVPALQASIARWQESLAQKDEHIRNLEERLHALQADKDTHIHHLNLHIIGMQKSTSWKATAPARKLITLTRRLNRGLKLLPSVIRRGGGLKSTVRKTISVWRQHGTAGLIARARWVANPGSSSFVSPESGEVIHSHDYASWVKLYDTLDDNDRWRISEEIRQWKDQPLISIIMPVYNPPMDLLREAIDSVTAQLYKNWELCIADDASTDPEVIAYLKGLTKQDQRFKVVLREKNGHISKASNSALELASGRYVALMDNDDLLPAHALYWIARAVHENPDAAVIYSDEDKIDVEGNRSAPYFKTDWNLYLFRSHNMISHLGVYRRDLVQRVGGFREGMEGSQDYDLALRCVEQVRPDQIVHIPHVLYHWRVHPGSTAMSLGEKPYAQIAGQNALDQHLQRIGIKGHAELLDFGMYRVHYDLPADQPLVSLIIPTRNAVGLVRQCIESITSKTSYQHYEIILVDNGSDDPESLQYFESLKLQQNIRVLRDDGPFNYSALNNRAVREARGELVGLINNDIEVISPDWLSEMVSLALQPGAGAVGARLWYPDNRLQHGGVIMGPLTLAGHAHKMLPRGHHGYFGRASLIQGMSAVTAACLIVRKSIFEEVGGLNEVELKIAFNDVDFCLKVMAAGYQNIWTPNADLYHHESATRGLEDTPEKIERFKGEVRYVQEKWAKIIANDPAYNPNLSFELEDFSLAFPPRIAQK